MYRSISMFCSVDKHHFQSVRLILTNWLTGRKLSNNWTLSSVSSFAKTIKYLRSAKAPQRYCDVVAFSQNKCFENETSPKKPRILCTPAYQQSPGDTTVAHSLNSGETRILSHQVTMQGRGPSCLPNWDTTWWSPHHALHRRMQIPPCCWSWLASQARQNGRRRLSQPKWTRTKPRSRTFVTLCVPLRTMNCFLRMTSRIPPPTLAKCLLSNGLRSSTRLSSNPFLQ